MIRALPRPTLVVLGTGMAGAKVVEEILVRDPHRFHIRMFGAEPEIFAVGECAQHRGKVYGLADPLKVVANRVALSPAEVTRRPFRPRKTRCLSQFWVVIGRRLPAFLP